MDRSVLRTALGLMVALHAVAALADPPKLPVVELRDGHESVPTGVFAYSKEFPADQQVLATIESVEPEQDRAFHERCMASVPWKNKDERPDYCYRAVFLMLTMDDHGKTVLSRSEQTRTGLYYDWDHFLVQEHGPELPLTNMKELANLNAVLREVKFRPVKWTKPAPAALDSKKPPRIHAPQVDDTIELADYVSGTDPKACFKLAKPKVETFDLDDQNMTIARITRSACEGTCAKRMAQLKCAFKSSAAGPNDSALYWLLWTAFPSE